MDLNQTDLLVRTERPNRRRLITEANEALALYYGGVDELRDLIRLWSPNEDPGNYTERVAITADNYRNLLKQIVNKYLEAITRAGGITRTCSDAGIEAYLKGRYAGYFWGEIAPYVLTLPEFWVQAAYPVPNGPVQTEQDRLDMQGNPYLTVQYPQFIRNFERDRDGNLLWVTIERPTIEMMGNGQTQSVLYIDYYDGADYVTYAQRNDSGKASSAKNAKPGDKNAVKITRETDPMSHGFEGVPFRRFAFAENNALIGEPKIGHSRMADVIRGCKGLLHWISMMVEAGHIHLRLILVGPKKTGDAIQQEGYGNTGYIPEDASGLPVGGHPVRFLEKPRTEFDILDRIVYERKPEEIYEDARLRDPSVKKAAESGFAKLLDMIPDLGVNTENRDYLAACDRSIIELMAGPKATVTVEYPASFDVKSINEKTKETADSTAAMRNGGLPRSTTADQLLSAQLYDNLLSNLDDKTRAIIDKELKARAAQMATTQAAQDLSTTAAPYPRAADIEGEGL